MRKPFELTIAMLVGCVIILAALQNSGMLLLTGRPFDTYRQEFDGHEYVVFRSSTGALCSQHSWNTCKKCQDYKGDCQTGTYKSPAPTDESPVGLVPLCPDCGQPMIELKPGDEKLIEVKERETTVIRLTDPDKEA